MDDYNCKVLSDGEMIERMVSAFLAWRLPSDFAPDAGIHFDAPTQGSEYLWPTGTNLLSAAQAKEMVKTMLDAASAPNA